jgi:hypothetical protein
MLSAAMNELAMLRVLVVHGGRSGDAFGLFLAGVIVVGVLAWALSCPGTRQSSKS